MNTDNETVQDFIGFRTEYGLGGEVDNTRATEVLAFMAALVAEDLRQTRRAIDGVNNRLEGIYAQLRDIAGG